MAMATLAQARVAWALEAMVMKGHREGSMKEMLAKRVKATTMEPEEKEMAKGAETMTVEKAEETEMVTEVAARAAVSEDSDTGGGEGDGGDGGGME